MSGSSQTGGTTQASGHPAKGGSRRRWALALSLVFAGFLAQSVLHVTWRGSWDTPPVPYDPMVYESIAWNLWQGRGFGNNWGDAAFRQPYMDKSPDAEWIEKGYHHYLTERVPGTRTPKRDVDGNLVFKTDEYVTTAYVPLGMPGLLAGVYSVAGRSFWVYRLLECVMLAAGLTAGVGLAGGLLGVRGAVIVGVMAAVDTGVRRYAGQFMTEPSALLLVMGFAVALVLALRTKRRRWVWVAVGVYGLMLVFRNMFVFWWPVVAWLLGAAWWATRRARSDAGSGDTGCGWRRPWRQRGAILTVGVGLVGVSVLVPLPWYVRNCVVLEAFMPLGTQGGIGMPGGFGEPAMRGDPVGVWVWPSWEFYAPVREALDGTDVPKVFYEREEAKLGQQHTLAWVREYPHLVPYLMYRHVWVMYSSNYSRWGLVWLVVGVLGPAVLAWRQGDRLVSSRMKQAWPGLGVCWALIAVNTFGVMITYAAGWGRFLMPVLPLAYVIGAYGLLCAWQAVKPRRAAEALPGKPD